MTENSVTSSNQSSADLFVDPGSKSTGWAFVVAGSVEAHGTIVATHEKDVAWDRIFDIHFQYYQLPGKLEFNRFHSITVHFERMNYQVHYAVVHSVGAIATGLMAWNCEIGEEISPFAWQKTVGWDRKQKTNHIANVKLSSYHCISQDEAAAVGMALHFLEQSK